MKERKNEHKFFSLKGKERHEWKETMNTKERKNETLKRKTFKMKRERKEKSWKNKGQ